jgi:hypothetical protein
MLKRRIYTVKQRNIYPPIVTHNMINEGTCTQLVVAFTYTHAERCNHTGKDEILNHLRRVKLWNDPADRVKVCSLTRARAFVCPALMAHVWIGLCR